MNTPDFDPVDKKEGKRDFLRVGIVGCGRVAKHHVRFINETENTQIVGLADKDEANARELAKDCGTDNFYGSLDEMLASVPMDVLHILTPPKFHYEQAVAAINRCVHVLIEKPCTLRAKDTKDLYQLAAEKGVLICPDFIQIFHPNFQHAISIIASGDLGRVIHIESQLGVDATLREFREAIGLFWSFKLPGGVLHNYITHPLYLVLHWLDRLERVTVINKAHGFLPQGLTDHLVIALEGERTTGSIILSCAMHPLPYFVQIFCERGAVLVDFNTSTVLVTKKSRLPGSLSRVTANLERAYQLSIWSLSNIINFVRGKLVPYQGLQTLIPSFYRSINHALEPPISSDLAIAVAEVEEAVFAQAGKLQLSTSRRPSTQVNITQQEKVLVTGSTGYVGLQVVRQLVKDGYYVRALVRALSHTHSLEQLGVELIYGDIRDFDNVSEAAEGMDIVVHMAAALGGAANFVLDCCVEGTKNVAEAARVKGVKRVIYMSSMSVYDFFRMKNGHEITAESPLEESPELRGIYSLAKRRGEDVALSHLEDKSPAWTILRPSLIVGGNGRNIFSPAGVRIGNILICPSSPHKNLRLIHVEDVGEVISMFIKNEGTSHHLYNLSDPGSLTLRDYVDNFLRESGYRDIKAIYVPYWLAYIGSKAIMAIHKITGKGPSLNMRRLAYAYRNVSVRSKDFNEQTGWQPREGILERLKKETEVGKMANSMKFQ